MKISPRLILTDRSDRPAVFGSFVMKDSQRP